MVLVSMTSASISPAGRSCRQAPFSAPWTSILHSDGRMDRAEQPIEAAQRTQS